MLHVDRTHSLFQIRTSGKEYHSQAGYSNTSVMPLLDLLCKCGFNTLLVLLTSFVSAILQNQISLSGVLPKFEPLCPLYWVSAAFRNDKTFHRGTFKTSHFSAKFVESERNFFFGLHWIVIDLKALLPLVEPLCTVYWVAIYSERGVQIADVVENTETPKHWDTKVLKQQNIKTLKHSTVKHLQMQWHTKHAHNVMTCQKYLQHF